MSAKNFITFEHFPITALFRYSLNFWIFHTQFYIFYHRNDEFSWEITVSCKIFPEHLIKINRKKARTSFSILQKKEKFFIASGIFITIFIEIPRLEFTSFVYHFPNFQCKKSSSYLIKRSENFSSRVFHHSWPAFFLLSIIRLRVNAKCFMCEWMRREGKMILQIEKLNINNSIHSRSCKEKLEVQDNPTNWINFSENELRYYFRTFSDDSNLSNNPKFSLFSIKV